MRRIVMSIRDWGVFFLYFGVMSTLLWRFGAELIWLVVGAVFGLVILWLDHLAYVIAYPHELTPQRVIQLIKAKQFKEAYQLLALTSDERVKLFFHQALGQIVLIVLGIYLLTSNGGLFARGLILAMNLGILTKVWVDFIGETSRLKQWLFQNVKIDVSDAGLRAYVFAVTLLFLFLSFLATR